MRDVPPRAGVPLREALGAAACCAVGGPDDEEDAADMAEFRANGGRGGGPFEGAPSRCSTIGDAGAVASTCPR